MLDEGFVGVGGQENLHGGVVVVVVSVAVLAEELVEDVGFR